MLPFSRGWMFAFFCVVVLLNLVAFAQAPPNAPVEIRVPVAQTPVKANGRLLLAYEIHITNFQARENALNRIEVYRDAANQAIVSLKEDDLLAAVVRPGAPAVADKRVISG